MTDMLLLQPLSRGVWNLKNRVVMAPMTRSRAGAGNVVAPVTAEYYRQRASAGLIVSEGTQISPEGVGYPNTPGVYDEAQRDGWRRITSAVHEAGSTIVAQLWHVGRVSHVFRVAFMSLVQVRPATSCASAVSVSETLSPARYTSDRCC